MKSEEIIRQIHYILEPRSEILFAYIFGSAITSEQPNDIDVAVYLEDPDILEKNPLYDIRLSNAIEKAVKLPVDVIIMNTAPDHLIHEISKGIIIVNKDDDMRVDFITLAWKKYFEMAPKRREWLREATR